jgi:formylglycine-generating enzyme required for sulfatase activity
VINVSWHDASAYVVWLTKVTGKPYRLLSEAEWEYCCRAGSITAYSFGDDIAKTQAQFSEGRWSSAKQTTEAGQFPANAFGLYDMHGNVWEWCGDSWHDDYQQAPADGSTWTTGKGYSRVFRGGSWLGLPRFVRSAVRGGAQPGDRSYDLGFRVARTLMPE